MHLIRSLIDVYSGSQVYLERVLSYGELDLCPSNWKRLVLGLWHCLVNSQYILLFRCYHVSIQSMGRSSRVERRFLSNPQRYHRERDVSRSLGRGWWWRVCLGTNWNVNTFNCFNSTWMSRHRSMPNITSICDKSPKNIKSPSQMNSWRKRKRLNSK